MHDSTGPHYKTVGSNIAGQNLGKLIALKEEIQHWRQQS